MRRATTARTARSWESPTGNDRQVFWLEYDEDENLSAARDLEGRRVEYGHTDGRLTAVTDVLGHEWTYEYDAKGRMTKKTDAEGRSRFIGYDAYGNVTQVTDGAGHGHFFQFDHDSGTKEYYAQIKTTSGMIKEVWFDQDGETRRVDVNGRTIKKIVKDGRTLLITDERGNVTRKEFDEWKNLTRVVHPDGSTVLNEYEHAFNQRVSSTDERGVRTEYSYDDSGHLSSKIEAKGTSVQRETRYTYDSNGNLLTIERVSDSTTVQSLTVMEYDSSGNMTSVTDPEGGTTTFTHDVMGNVLTRTDPLGKVWTTTHDDAGRLTSATDPLGHATTVEYDGVGNKVREVDAEGKEKAFAYDEHNNVILSTDTAGSETHHEYNTDGKLTRRTDPEGKSVDYRYDSEGRLIEATDGSGNATAIEYENGSGGCSSCSAPLDKPSMIVYPTFSREYKYDARGRKIQERDILSDTETLVTTYGYDPSGNLVSVTDKESKTTANTYDELNRLVSTTDPTAHETLYGYDSRDNLISLTDGNGNTTRFEYDRNNRKTREVRPLGQATRYAYDRAGRLTNITDPKTQASEYVYDDAGRLNQALTYSASDPSTPEKTITFTLDKAGHLKGYDDGETSASYDYDDAYRKIAETVTYGPFQLTQSTTWYANGLKKTFTGPDNVTYSYDYNANNQLRSVEIPGKGFITTNAYTWLAPASITYPGGTTREMTYDPLMRIQSIQVKDPAQSLLMSYAYTHDKMDHITKKVTENGDHVYTYDDLYRLTQTDNPALSDEAYTYDPVGNRLTSKDTQGDWSYNGNNVSFRQACMNWRAGGGMIG